MSPSPLSVSPGTWRHAVKPRGGHPNGKIEGGRVWVTRATGLGHAGVLEHAGSCLQGPWGHVDVPQLVRDGTGEKLLNGEGVGWLGNARPASDIEHAGGGPPHVSLGS